MAPPHLGVEKVKTSDPWSASTSDPWSVFTSDPWSVDAGAVARLHVWQEARLALGPFIGWTDSDIDVDLGLASSQAQRQGCRWPPACRVIPARILGQDLHS